MGFDSVIFIRTDGNSKIATGHLVRCLCITQALENLGKKVVFLVSNEESQTLLNDLTSSVFSDVTFSYETIILKDADYQHLEQELPELVKILQNYTMPVLFIDSYYVTPDYFAVLKPYAKLAYMDDLRSFDYDVNMIINYDVVPISKQLSYEQSYTKTDRLLLGARYTPLRPQFQNQEYILRDKVQNILITTGGSDPLNFCNLLVPNLLNEHKATTLHVIIGRLFSEASISELERLASSTPFLKLYRNVSNMASIMKQCDLAISAAGTTLYELSAIGVPTVSITFADNQLIMADTFDEVGAIPYAGDLRSPTASLNMSTLRNVVTMILNLTGNLNKRKELHLIMKSLVDSNGVYFIANSLCQLA